MEHSLHIAAKHFVEAAAPASTAAIRKKVKKVKKAEIYSYIILIPRSQRPMVMMVTMKMNMNIKMKIPNLCPETHLARPLLLLRRYIFHSTIIFLPHTFLRSGNHPRQEYFSKHHAIKWGLGVKPLELLLWIRTRWASLYKFLERIILKMV